MHGYKGWDLTTIIYIMTEHIDELIAAPLAEVEKKLYASLGTSDLEVHVNALCTSVIRAGGKRLRPKLCLLAAKMLCPADERDEQFTTCAAALELLHTATLLHDDVIDKAPLRRGTPTLNETDGNHVAVLSGDYMFTRCFLMMQEIDCKALSRLSTRTISALVAGEIEQLQRQGDLTITLEDYRHTVFCKTGALFMLSAAGPALITGQPEATIEALKTFGIELGICFHIVDDMLEYSSTDE